MRTPAACLTLAAALALSACETVMQGPSRLTGQRLDAAVALYGPWAEEIQLSGQPLYIWRRTLLVKGEPQVCELRVQLGYHDIIKSAVLQGVGGACELYAVRTEGTTH
jgi:hypothetical protein